MRSIGTWLQIAGITTVCVFAFLISYKIAGVACGAALVYVGLAAD